MTTVISVEDPYFFRSGWLLFLPFGGQGAPTEYCLPPRIKLLMSVSLSALSHLELIIMIARLKAPMARANPGPYLPRSWLASRRETPFSAPATHLIQLKNDDGTGQEPFSGPRFEPRHSNAADVRGFCDPGTSLNGRALGEDGLSRIYGRLVLVHVVVHPLSSVLFKARWKARLPERNTHGIGLPERMEGDMVVHALYAHDGDSTILAKNSGDFNERLGDLDASVNERVR
ncbi:hypothetical protein C8F01DRAFT_1237282 [Mycena amicta]|nr:hypothetical protein C8F01DRAFT_1237282 [Mycena amicta]